MGSLSKSVKEMSSSTIKGQLGSLRKHNMQQVLAKAEAFLSKVVPASEIVSYEPNIRHMLESMERQAKTAQEFIEELQSRESPDHCQLISEDELAEWNVIFCNAEDACAGLRISLESCEKRLQHELNLEKIRSREPSRSVSPASSLANIVPRSTVVFSQMNQENNDSPDEEETAVKYPCVDLEKLKQAANQVDKQAFQKESDESKSNQDVVRQEQTKVDSFVGHSENIGRDYSKSLVDTCFQQIRGLEQQILELKLASHPGMAPGFHCSPNVSSVQLPVMKVKLPKLSIPRFDGNPSNQDVVRQEQTKVDSFVGHSENIGRDYSKSLVDTCFQQIRGLEQQILELKLASHPGMAPGFHCSPNVSSVQLPVMKVKLPKLSIPRFDGRRYGKKDVRVSSIYTKLRDLALYGTDQSNVRTFTDLLETNLRQLEAMGEQIENQQMVTLIKGKLPYEIMLRFSEKMELKGVPWSVALLRQFLEQHVTVLQSVSQTEMSYRTKSKEWRDASEQRGGKYHFSKGPSTRTATGGALISQGSCGSGTKVIRSSEDFQGKGYTEKQKNQASAREFQTNAQLSRSCIYCKQMGHYHENCSKIKAVDDRKKLIANESRCYNCLMNGHGVKTCQKSRNCFHCGLWGHHASICTQRNKQVIYESSRPLVTKAKNFKFDQPALVSASNQQNEINPSQQVAEETLISPGETVLMQTAQAVVENSSNPKKQRKVRIFIDRGSQRTYILKKVVKELDLKPISAQPLSISTFGTDKTMIKESELFSVMLQLKDGNKLELKANAVPVITQPVQRTKISADLIPFKEETLADKAPEETEIYEIELLLGLDYAEDVIGSTKLILAPGLYAIDSKLGWIISGRTGQHSENSLNTLALHVSQSVIENDPFALERLGIFDNSNNKTFDDLAVEIFEQTVQVHDRRYSVTWPWKENMLPESGTRNFALAHGRLISTVKRLKQSPELMQKYDGIIQEQIDKGIVELAPSVDKEAVTVYYMPHHPVITPQKATTKVRIVYDASAKPSKDAFSLNDCLLRGPVLLEKLAGLLLRFRTKEIVLLSDIEKAFHQIQLQASQRDACRFLWLKDSSNFNTHLANLQFLRFKRMPFGVISSPWLLAAVVNYHLQNVNSPVTKAILDNIYVDNVVAGVRSCDEAHAFYKEAKQVFQDAAMNLREWSSNCNEFLSKIPDKDRADGDIQTVLGIKWNRAKDNLTVSTGKKEFETSTVTKRIVIQQLASIFDPLGFFGPVTIKARIFLQELWIHEMSWDQPLSKQLKQEWQELVRDFENITCVSVSRFVGCPDNSERELHCFTDASSKAYSAAIYLKVGQDVNLIFAKSRVAPKKALTIPRLELMGVWIGVKTLRFVIQQMKLVPVKSVVWCDSACVLWWLKTEKPLSVWVTNRLKEIRSQLDQGTQFLFVSTKTNPADIGTRGCSVKELESSMWFKGPDWLSKTEQEWPNHDIPDNKEVEEECKSEVKKKRVMVLGNLDSKETANKVYQDYFSRWSSMKKLVKATVYWIRVMNKLRHPKEEIKKERMTLEEFDEAKKRLEIWVQKHNFWETFKSIKSGKPDMLMNTFGLKLCPKDGLLRCCGRMRNAELTDDARYPKLLPKGDPFTKLVVENIHEKLHHAGPEHTLSQIRYEYWIPKGRQEVKNILRKCLMCRRYEGGPYVPPQMPPWPEERVSRSTPFLFTGLDYFGPLHVAVNSNVQKMWVSLFTCLATRGIHLELVESLSTKSFINGLKRFISEYGAPKQILCDNAPAFKLGKTVLDRIWKQVVQDSDVTSYVVQMGIKWQFIVEMAPWMGGSYERLIGTVKRALRKALGQRTVNDDEMRTLLSEVKRTVNSRPITYVGDFSYGYALTPNDFLHPGSRKGIPPFPAQDKDEEYKDQKLTSTDILVKEHQNQQKCLERFWNQWYSEYLLNQRERTQVKMKTPRIQAKTSPKINDIVQIGETKLPRGAWKIAKIVELHKSRDGEIRSARIQLPNGRKLNRAICQLYPLAESIEFDERSLIEDNNKTEIKEQVSDVKRSKPMRLAATNAKQKMNQVIKKLNQSFSDSDEETIS